MKSFEFLMQIERSIIFDSIRTLFIVALQNGTHTKLEMIEYI